jgi:hypothetical protein
MWSSSAVIPSFCQHSTRVACCVSLLFWCTSLAGQEDRSGSPASQAVEQEALKVLNQSDWAHTVTPTLQDVPCTDQNPAFPGLYPRDTAAGAEARASVTSSEVIKPDSSEYLIRFQSAKPVQTAIQQLVAMGEKWSAYDLEKRKASIQGPTDLVNARYNFADMITIAVILKHPGPDGTSLFDYGYRDEGHTFPAASFRIFPCAGLRTSNGQVFVHVVPVTFGYDGQPKSLQLSFPRLIDGKPLISTVRERVDFRLIVNQRVFETSFLVNASDVLDGSERSLYLPSAFTDSKEITQQ